MRNLSVRVARWSARHPWRAIGGWLVFVAVCLGVGIGVGNNAAVTADYRVGEAGRAEAIAAEGGLQRRPVEHVLITARDSAELDASTVRSTAAEVASRMSTLPVVAAVSEPVWAKDRRAVRVDVTLEVEEREASRVVDDLQARTQAIQDAHPEVVVTQTGRASITRAVEKQRGQDIARVELITLPITLITLLVVFWSLSLALVPVLLALSSIAAAIGLSMVVSHVFPDAGVGMNIILLIGMAVEIATAIPDSTTARPDVAAARSTRAMAESLPPPRARSSRSRLR